MNLKNERCKCKTLHLLVTCRIDQTEFFGNERKIPGTNGTNRFVCFHSIKIENDGPYAKKKEGEFQMYSTFLVQLFDLLAVLVLMLRTSMRSKIIQFLHIINFVFVITLQ